ncbi:MAG TPA: hypothetical protein VK915_02385 [Gaiellaceae bacterium]|nr:hypothetical protein [Gaiellaceae bacterium]
MRIALATSASTPPQFDDDRLLIEALAGRGAVAEPAVWDDPSVAWDRFDLVVLRSTWDYPRKREAFLAWVESLGNRVRNSAAVVRWNSDKRYLTDLVVQGLPVVPTLFVAPADPIPAFEGEVVVKPTVSAGGRDTGRFGPAAHHAARALVDRLQREGRTAMVQPYLPSVDVRGETALVFVAGRFSHALRKRAVLRPDEEAPVRRDALGAAEAMYDPDLVEATEASSAEQATANAVLRELARRFGAAPTFVRVDVLAAQDGDPVLLELEAVEPYLYLAGAPGAADRLAGAILESG